MTQRLRALGLAILLGSAAPGIGRAFDVTGIVVDGNGSPVEGVDLDVFDSATGVKQPRANDKTDAAGSFTVVLGPGTFDIGLDTAFAVGGPFAPGIVAGVVVNGGVDLGLLQVDPGLVLSGRVLDPNGKPLRGVDIDIEDAATRDKLFTPNDNTDLLGRFSFPTEAGAVFVSIDVPATSKLASIEVGPIALAGDTDLGDLVASPGSLLTGRALSPTGGPLGGVDLDANHSTGGAPIALGDDNTDARTGAYEVVVPNSTIDLTFTAPQGSVLAPSIVPGIVVTAAPPKIDGVLFPTGSDPAPDTLRSGETYRGVFSTPSEIDEVWFDGVANATLAVKSIGRATVPDFDLFAPSGARVPMIGFARGSSSGSSLGRLALPESGTYRIVLFSRSGAAGPYDLRLLLKPASSDARVRASVDVATPNQFHDVSFAGLEGGTLTAKIKPARGSALQPSVVQVRAPSGALVPVGSVLSVRGTSLAIQMLPLPETGTYQLRLTGAASTTGTADVALAIAAPRASRTIVVEP